MEDLRRTIVAVSPAYGHRPQKGLAAAENWTRTTRRVAPVAQRDGYRNEARGSMLRVRWRKHLDERIGGGPKDVPGYSDDLLEDSGGMPVVGTRRWQRAGRRPGPGSRARDSAVPQASGNLDIEYPRLGLIQIDAFDQAMMELRQSMK